MCLNHIFQAPLRYSRESFPQEFNGFLRGFCVGEGLLGSGVIALHCQMKRIFILLPLLNQAFQGKGLSYRINKQFQKPLMILF